MWFFGSRQLGQRCASRTSPQFEHDDAFTAVTAVVHPLHVAGLLALLVGYSVIRWVFLQLFDQFLDGHHDEITLSFRACSIASFCC